MKTKKSDFFSRRHNCFPLYFTTLFLSLCLISSVIYGQNNFTPLEEGDYTIEQEHLKFDPKVEIGGSFRMFWGTQSPNIFPITDRHSSWGQTIRLNLKSRVNYHISVNATLKNESDYERDQANGYSFKDPNDRGKDHATTNTGMNAVFEEAYLDYRHNPSASLKLGRQYINIADRKGLVYEGVSNGISQQCLIGTWCYYIGAAKLEDGVDDVLYWAQLDYPVYESGVLIDDPWKEEKERDRESLNVELFRAFYHGKDIPLAKYGGWTGRESDYHTTSNNKPVYFDNKGTEYAGVNIKWYNHGFEVDFSLSLMTGERDYHTGTQNEHNVETLAERNISGNAAYLDLGYRLSDEWKWGYTYFIASGNDPKKGTENFWDEDSKGYLEVQKGSHGKALFYFDGADSFGNNHSVSNLSYTRMALSYRSDKLDEGFDFDMYQFRRVAPVYNEEGKRQYSIGREFDFSYYKYINERLRFDTFLAMFQADGAYSANDNVVPEDDPTDQSLVGASLSYNF